MFGSDILMVMLMVIFGAGASYDSAEAFRLPYPGGGGFSNFGSPPMPSIDGGAPWRPPLAKNLFLNPDREFGKIVEKYPKLAHVLPYLRSPSGGKSVEQTLESLQVQGTDYPERQRELAAIKFYLADLLMQVTDEWYARTNGVTNYVPLMAEILRLDKSNAEICLVTFNYDLLLERALVSFRDFNMKGPEDFLSSHPRLKIFKLHGSVNWSRTVGTQGAIYTPDQIIEQADFLRPSDRFVSANAARKYQGPGSIFPAIAIPVQTKTENHFECPTAHREYLRDMLPQVRKILIIGWQAREAHFLQMLRSNIQTLEHLMVVGRDYNESVTVAKYFLGEIGKARRPREYYGQAGFTRFIVDQEGEEFLRA